MMQYRTNSPRGDPRPVHDSRMPSPKSAYPQHQQPYPPHPDVGHPGAMESGPPPPPPPPQGMPNDTMHREHERPASVGPKRMREWEDEQSVKKPASEENRARMDNIHHRRPSTPPREPFRRNSEEQARRFEDHRRMDDPRRMEDQRRPDDPRRMDEMRRAEEQRHPNDSYHPSEAAHHPPAHSMPNHLPPMQQGPSPMQGIMHESSANGAGPKDYPPEDRSRMEHGPSPPPPHPTAINEPERAARKMDVDEDYDDSGEDEKKAGIGSGGASGPGSATSEMKNGTPTSAGINGMMGPKVEASWRYKPNMNLASDV